MHTAFKGKLAWITGASSGIGEALAYELSKAGARLILSARDGVKMEQVKENCANKQEVYILPLDLRSHNLEEKVLFVVKEYGVVDYMFHNAGMAARDTVEVTDLEVYKTIMQTNFFGPVAITKALLPYCIKRKSGHFVVVSSLSGKYGVPKLSAYAASKHALHGFFDSLRAEVKKSGINVTIVIPGFINTGIIKNSIDGRGMAKGENMKVNEKGMSPQHCAMQILKAVAANKREVLIGGMEIWSVYINRFFPGLFSRIIRNRPVKKLRSVRKVIMKLGKGDR